MSEPTYVMREETVLKLHGMFELGSELGMDMWAIYGGDLCLIYKSRDLPYASLAVYPHVHITDLSCFKAPALDKFEDVLDAFATREFEEKGWERKTKLPNVAFNPRNLMRYPHWERGIVPFRLPNVVHAFFMGKHNYYGWNIFVDERSRRYLVMRDGDSQLVVVYPEHLWRIA